MVLMSMSWCCIASWFSSRADVCSRSSYWRALRIAIAARLAKSLAGSSSRSSNVRPPSRSIVMTPMTSSPTESGTRMHACCSSSSVPGMYTARGSLSISLMSWASLWRTTQPLMPSSIEMAKSKISCSSCASRA